jgi:hypothetical protein
MKRETKVAIAAAALIVLAVVLFARNLLTDDSVKYSKPPTKAALEKQIAEIQKDPHMPDQAKAIAIGQIRARSQGLGAPTK